MTDRRYRLLHQAILGMVLASWLAVGALMVLLPGCAATAPTPSGSIAAAYGTLAAFNRTVASTLERGRITVAQAERMLAESRKARRVVDDAEQALTLCGGKMPCDSVAAILDRAQPMLLELERRLREEEAAAARRGAGA